MADMKGTVLEPREIQTMLRIRRESQERPRRLGERERERE